MWLMLYMQYSSYHIPIKFPIFFPKSTSLIFFSEKQNEKASEAAQLQQLHIRPGKDGYTISRFVPKYYYY